MDLKIGEIEYKTGRLDARKQFHVARKIGPAMFSMVAARAKASAEIPEGALSKVSSSATRAEEAVVEVAMVGIFKAVAEAMSIMSEADVDYVINICLSVCERKQQGAWGKVLAANGSMMFEDIDVRTLMRLGLEVIKENLGSFFSAPLEALT